MSSSQKTLISLYLAMMIISMFFDRMVKIDRIQFFFGKLQTIAKRSAKKVMSKKWKKKLLKFLSIFRIDPDRKLFRSRSKIISIGIEFFRSDRIYDQRSFLPALFWKSDRIIFNEIFSRINFEVADHEFGPNFKISLKRHSFLTNFVITTIINNNFFYLFFFFFLGFWGTWLRI